MLLMNACVRAQVALAAARILTSPLFVRMGKIHAQSRRRNARHTYSVQLSSSSGSTHAPKSRLRRPAAVRQTQLVPMGHVAEREGLHACSTVGTGGGGDGGGEGSKGGEGGGGGSLQKPHDLLQLTEERKSVPCKAHSPVLT